ncbi:MAG: DUF3307 domain-containing protein [Duncaniella sp.]|nr:DUF3307 domain-containing protein [Duncaniella sp.]
MIIILLKLIAAHLLGDFLFQSNTICDLKYNDILSKRLVGLTIHSSIQAILSYLLLAKWSLWIVPAVIFASHFTIDFIKVVCRGKRLPAFIADQVAHYIVIIGLWWFLCIKGYGSVTTSCLSLSFWAIFISYIAVLVPASIFIKSFIEFEGWIPNQSLSSTEEQIDQEKFPRNEESLKGLPNAGKWIGYLERVLILTFIYTNNIEGIGFLLAAKSVFRFGELNRSQDIKVTEYVLIGTFVSFTIAIIIGFGVKYIVGIF